MRRPTLLLAAGLASHAGAQGYLLSTAAVGTVPAGISYQGTLQENGAPASGTLTMTFSLFDAPSGGSRRWTSGPRPVQVIQGVFNAVLDVSTASLLGGGGRYLEMSVGVETLVPRAQLNAVPYALVARSVEAREGGAPYLDLAPRESAPAVAPGRLYLDSRGPGALKVSLDGNAFVALSTGAAVSGPPAPSSPFNDAGDLQVGAATASTLSASGFLTLANLGEPPPGAPGRLYFDAGLGRLRLHDGAGFVDVATGPARTPAAPLLVSVRAYGARGDAVHDDAAAIQAAIDAFPNGKVRLFFPSGIYRVTAPLRVRSHHVVLEGEGRQTTVLNFDAPAGGTLLQFKKDGAVLRHCALKGLALSSPNSNRASKTALELDAVAEMQVEDLGIYPWRGPGAIGLLLRGHEATRIVAAYIHTARPILIERNAVPSTPVIDADHFHFHDTYLICHSDEPHDGAPSTHPCVQIADGVVATNVTFDGYQAWAGGAHGLFWETNGSARASHNLAVRNLRWEQGTPGGYAIYISNRASGGDLHPTQAVHLENIHLNTPGTQGICLRNVRHSSIVGVIYGGTAEALRLEKVRNLFVAATFFQAGSKIVAEQATHFSGAFEWGFEQRTALPP